jgi:hypothetical protein
MSSLRAFFLSAFWISAMACSLAAAGCGRQPAIDTLPVEGIVTLDGQPLAGATVTFIPVQEGAGVSATGTTDSSGKYLLTAVGAGLGAEPGAGTSPGEYYIGVVKDAFPDDPEARQERDVLALQSSSGDATKPSRPKAMKVTHVVPQKFNDPRKSGIKKTVQNKANNIPIELASK